MTVKELIEELQKQDPEAEISTEGCDCWGDVGRVEADDPKYNDGRKVVSLYRS